MYVAKITWCLLTYKWVWPKGHSASWLTNCVANCSFCYIANTILDYIVFGFLHSLLTFCRYASAACVVMWCMSVCPSSFSMLNGVAILWREPKPPNGGIECRWCRHKSRFGAYIWLDCLLLTLQQAGVVKTVAGGPRPHGCDTSLVVSGGVDCTSRWRNGYDKKPQCYAKDNRTAHITAYITNNKRLLDVLYYWS